MSESVCSSRPEVTSSRKMRLGLQIASLAQLALDLSAAEFADWSILVVDEVDGVQRLVDPAIDVCAGRIGRQTQLGRIPSARLKGRVSWRTSRCGTTARFCLRESKWP